MTRELTDETIWDAAQAGDPVAFGALFDRHADAVHNYCFRLTASWTDAQDLTSITFLETWRRREDVELSADGSLRPWLFGVASLASRNVRRSNRRWERLLANLPREAHAVDTAEIVADRHQREQQMLRVREAISHLSRPDQDVLAACVWGELSYADAAIALGVPVGTVRSRLSRAKGRVAARLSPDPSLPSLPQSSTLMSPQPSTNGATDEDRPLE